MNTRIWIWVLLLLAASCTNKNEQWLEKAEACIETDPTCAYQCLQQVVLEAEELTDDQQAKHALLLIQTMHKCRMPLVNDSLANMAVAHYQKTGDRHSLAKSLLYKGLVHKQNGQVEQAVEAFAASERNFERVEDNQYKALLFDHYGMLLLKQAMYKEALHYFKLTQEHELKGDSAHYVVSTFRRMAMVYDLLGHKDSARACYMDGLSYAKEKDVRSKNYYLLLQNYASFLTESGDYSEAERLLLQCTAPMADSAYVHTLYSSLAALHYEKGEYEQALDYAMRVIESKDSLTVCGGYLRLYKIHREMGNLKMAVHYHDLYRSYDNDLAMRRQTAQIAAIPHRVENRLLMRENLIWRQSQWGWIGLIAIIFSGGMALLHFTRKRHGKEQNERIQQIKTMKCVLNETEQQLSERTVNIGGLKGVVTSQSNAINRLKEEQLHDKEKHRKEIRSLKENIRLLETDIHKLKDEGRSLKRTESEQEQNLRNVEKELKAQAKKLATVEHQHAIDQRINHFVMTAQDTVAIDLLLQLRYGKEVHTRYDIHPKEYLPLLEELLKQESPERYEKLKECRLEPNKLTMCYLIALGLDDVEMMARAAFLGTNSVKAYRKECRNLVTNPTILKHIAILLNKYYSTS